jgi:1-acyl-sn-glycerol-3-phosphate acyltransferase
MGALDLLRLRRFGPFFWTQFLGALNDNVFRNALVILFAFRAVAGAVAPDTLVNLSTALFIAPFFLFSAAAGQLADKIDKSRLIRLVKVIEIVLMGVGAVALRRDSVPLLLVLLFLMGVHSTLFGPVKYSILPQHLRAEELVGGNALVQTGTFAAILLGTIVGGILAGIPDAGRGWVGVVILAVAIAGWLASRGIPAAPPSDPDLRVGVNPVRETLRTMAFARENRTVFLSILGISWFWFYGALLLAQLPGLTRDALGGSESVVTLLLTVFSIGVAIGCLLCERMSEGAVELGLVPLGSLGLTLFALDLYFATHTGAPQGAPLGAAAFLRAPHAWRVLADVGLIGASGGFFIVPLQALVQQRSRPDRCSQVIAAGNILSALFMVLAALIAIGLRHAGFTIPQLVLLVGVLNAGAAIYIYWLIPEFLMALIVWLLVHTVYRLRRRGIENVPESGPLVLVSNHVTFVDALVIVAALRRPVRFVMEQRYFRVPIVHFVCRTAGAIPIASRRTAPSLVEHAFDAVAEALAAGDIVCIFPEGRLTTDGNVAAFRPGIERIIARTPVPVLPVALVGLWGSFFSRKDGKPMRRPFRRFWSRIEVVCGAPVPPADVTAAMLRERVLALCGVIA